METSEVNTSYAYGFSLAIIAAYLVDIYWIRAGFSYVSAAMVAGFLIQYFSLRLKIFFLKNRQGRQAINAQMKVSIATLLVNILVLSLFLKSSKNYLLILGFLIAFHLNIFFIVLISYYSKNKHP